MDSVCFLLLDRRVLVLLFAIATGVLYISQQKRNWIKSPNIKTKFKHRFHSMLKYVSEAHLYIQLRSSGHKPICTLGWRKCLPLAWDGRKHYIKHVCAVMTHSHIGAQRWDIHYSTIQTWEAQEIRMSAPCYRNESSLKTLLGDSPFLLKSQVFQDDCYMASVAATAYALSMGLLKSHLWTPVDYSGVWI